MARWTALHGIEGVVRTLAFLRPKPPAMAVVSVNNWCPGKGSFVRRVEDETERVCRHYGIACLSQRRALEPLVEAGTLELHVRDGFQGYAEKGPYDAIHVGAAPERVPEALKQQLRPGGVLLLPVGPNGGAQEFVRVTRDARNPTSFSQQSLFGVRYVPLTTPEKQCPSGRR